MALPASAEPWGLRETVKAPNWLSISGSYRLRYESLDNSFRANPASSDQILAGRLLIDAVADFGGVRLGTELQDSRADLHGTGTPLDESLVNPAELLRAYVGVRRPNAFLEGDCLDITAGRVAFDLGSRRLVARNRYRNTSNAFSGVRSVWTGPGRTRVESFFLLPVYRQPTDAARLAANSPAWDDETWDTRFWGVAAEQRGLAGSLTAEFYLLGLSEAQNLEREVGGRRLRTAGTRWHSEPGRGTWDFEIETALQFGRSRIPEAPASAELEHGAGLVHVHVGRTWSAPGSPRFALLYDFASGDRDPSDDRNDRFDSLYGARRFEFGPTSIYGPISRGNLNAPGVRFEAQPSPRLDSFAGYRALFLASSRDALPEAELQDSSGAAGRFVGGQLEARLRFSLLPGILLLEFGGAYLVHGPFLRRAPQAPGQGDTAYLYTQSVLTF